MQIVKEVIYKENSFLKLSLNVSPYCTYNEFLDNSLWCSNNMLHLRSKALKPHTDMGKGKNSNRGLKKFSTRGVKSKIFEGESTKSK